MANNTNERTQAIHAIALRLLTEAGESADLRTLAHKLADEAGCVYETAKRHMRKAQKIAIGEPVATRGGSRGGGFPAGLKREGRRGKVKES